MAQFTPPNVPADFGNSPVPAGVYELLVYDTNYLSSKSGHPMIHFKFKIVSDGYTGKMVDAYMLMPEDPSYDYYNMMWGKFNGMQESMGIPKGVSFSVPDSFGSREFPQRVEFFHGKQCRAQLSVTDGSDGYDPKNELKSFKKPLQEGDLGTSFPSETSGMDDVPF